MHSAYLRFIALSKKYRLSQKIPFFVMVLAFFSGFLTYWSLTQNIDLQLKTKKTLLFLYFNVITLLLLSIFVVRRIVEIIQRHKKQVLGAKLHVHVVTLFSLFTIVPAICVAIFAAFFLHRGFESWFSEPVYRALFEAEKVANAYLEEHQRTIIIDAQAIAQRLRFSLFYMTRDKESLEEFLNREADERGLGEILLFNANQNILARSYLSFSLEIEKVALEDIRRAQNGEVVVNKYNDRVRALILLDKTSQTFMFIGKLVDEKVLAHVEKTRKSVKDYGILSQQHSSFQITFLIFFSLFVLLLLLASAAIALFFSNIFVRPISKIIHAANFVSQGDLSIVIKEEPLHNELDQLILSFNNMTLQLKRQKEDLILSEKKAAWADIARKIAHEIKNPLTPIQLSAERLRRKYLKEIQRDPEVFQQCIDIIVRQVGQIGHLVNEFSSFARMPEPKLKRVNVMEPLQQAVFLEQQAHPEVSFQLEGDDCFFLCDAQQISQVFTNVLQNAIIALENIENKKIHVYLKKEKEIFSITFNDSGIGFPKGDLKKLMEPYYTTRQQGTGLGLAIVSKIVRDHNGEMTLGESILGGAKVSLAFPCKEEI